MDADEILEGLTQEERLELLRRLIQDAERPRVEELSTEERLERLESIVAFGPMRWRGRRWHHAYGWHCCD